MLDFRGAVPPAECLNRRAVGRTQPNNANQARRPQPHHRDVARTAGYTEKSISGQGADKEHLAGAGGPKEERLTVPAGERAQ
jgi:hypothetical protein